LWPVCQGASCLRKRARFRREGIGDWCPPLPNIGWEQGEKLKTTKGLIIATAIELLGITIIGSGIGIEIALGADLGYVLVTVGSVITAGGGLIFAKLIRGRK